MQDRDLTGGKNLEDIQEMNRSLVIRMLHRMKVCSRAKLAMETGLKQATITNIIGDLINWGLVYETGIIEGDKGRRSIGIALDNAAYKVIGIRLTRKYVSIGLFDIGGTLYSSRQARIETSAGSDAAVKKMKDMIAETLKEAENDKVIGIGMGIPGPFFRREGRIVLMTEFPGWEHVGILEEIQSAFSLPVYIEHDANCAAIAEWWYGPHHRDDGTMIYIAAGQGIGAGIVIDGKLYRGSLGIAGEIGHTSIDYNGPLCECGNRGCLEMYCSSLALSHYIDSIKADYPDSLLKAQTSSAVFAAAMQGDTLALKVIERISMFLGIGITNLVNSFNPDVVIIGDDLKDMGDLLLKGVCSTVKDRTLNSIYNELKIELCSFEGDPVLVGASALALNRILENPSTFMEISTIS